MGGAPGQDGACSKFGGPGRARCTELGGAEGSRRQAGPSPAILLRPQGCYEKVKLWFDDNKHVLGTVGMCILIMQVRGPHLSLLHRGVYPVTEPNAARALSDHGEHGLTGQPPPRSDVASPCVRYRPPGHTAACPLQCSGHDRRATH